MTIMVIFLLSIVAGIGIVIWQSATNPDFGRIRVTQGKPRLGSIAVTKGKRKFGRIAVKEVGNDE